MSKLLRVLVFIFFVLSAIYYSWLNSSNYISESEYNKALSVIPPIQALNFGADRKMGNIIGVQAFVAPLEYSTEKRFFEKTENYLLEAKKKGWLNSKSLIVFPEHYGSFLFLVDEPASVFQSEDYKEAINKIISKKSPEYYKSYPFSKSQNPSTETVLRIKSSQMKKIYQDTFSTLSRIYQVNIIAGSIALPSTFIKNGDLELSDNGALENSGFLFLPDGKIHESKFSKKNLNSLEKMILAPGDSGKQKVKLSSWSEEFGILYSLDSLYLKNYTNDLLDNDIDIIVSPSSLIDGESIDWSLPEIYMNASEQKKPPEIINQDFFQNWTKYSILEKMKVTQARIGFQVFLQGKIFSTKFVGASNFTVRYVRTEMIETNKNLIFNLWL